MKLQRHSRKNATAQRAVHLALGIAAAVLLAGAPQLVRADTTPATSVDLEAVSVIPDGSPSTDSLDIGLVRVVFKDTNTVAADEVVFQIISPSGAVRQQIDDKGTFAPGARIVHTFPVPGIQDDDQIGVAMVKYTGGSTWTAPHSYIQSDNQQSVLSTGSALTPFGGN